MKKYLIEKLKALRQLFVMCRFWHDWHITFPYGKSAKRTCQRCGKIEWRYPEYNKWVG